MGRKRDRSFGPRQHGSPATLHDASQSQGHGPQPHSGHAMTAPNNKNNQREIHGAIPSIGNRDQHSINEAVTARWTRKVGIYTGVMAAATILLFLATGVSAYFLWESDQSISGQLREMHDQTVITRESYTAVQRPFVTAIGLKVSGQNYGAAATQNPLYLDFETTLENSGNTPTNDMRVISSVSFDTPAVPYSPPDPANLSMTDDPRPIVSDRFLGPHGKTEIGAIGLFRRNVDDMIQERRDFYIFGFVGYRDQFVGTPERITKYCYVVHPFKHEGGLSDVQYQTTCHHWNCGDQDCERDKQNYYAELQAIKLRNPAAAAIKRPVPLAASIPYFPEPLIKATP